MEDGGMAVNEISESRDKRPETRAKIAEKHAAARRCSHNHCRGRDNHCGSGKTGTPGKQDYFRLDGLKSRTDCTNRVAMFPFFFTPCWIPSKVSQQDSRRDHSIATAPAAHESIP
jgi:hypothetical protein